MGDGGSMVGCVGRRWAVVGCGGLRWASWVMVGLWWALVAFVGRCWPALAVVGGHNHSLHIVNVSTSKIKKRKVKTTWPSLGLIAFVGPSLACICWPSLACVGRHVGRRWHLKFVMIIE